VNPDPFPHVVLEWWFDRKLLEQVADEFPPFTDRRWRPYRKAEEVKYEGGASMWGFGACEYFDLLECRTPELSEMFAIPNLSMELVGGGYHLIPPGGRLAMHADFNRSPDTGLYRRLNVLTYLNPDWDESGGVLKLGADQRVEVVPEMGRTVIFATSAESWHGHPEPTVARWRKSIAAYFFSPEPAPGYVADNSTVWL
jgi:hypothetical protein